ncbi:peptidoglycan editing factor PgeF [Neobacillus sp. D3-1R]|uniref:peptidoglycan editing factor PgeF n=1 Tax=Neobacillus sp. D3-1R TaxID=3445778 RepID=UPI003F9F6418
MEPFVLKTKEYFYLLQWGNEFPQLTAGFTTKNGGYSKEEFSSLNLGLHVGDSNELVCKNKQKLSDLIQIQTTNWVAAEQTHGINIKKISKSDSGRGTFEYSDSIRDTDGFYTSEKGILLTLCYADCVPIYFLDKKSKMIGVAHAGWKGTVHGIAREMIQKWTQEGIDPKNILVAIGPSICEKCYIVDDFVIDFVQKILEDVEEKPYNQIKEGQYQLNLKQLNKILLIQSGVLESNISVTNYCSSCHHNEFFSHRRDYGKSGRMMGFIGWKED